MVKTYLLKPTAARPPEVLARVPFREGFSAVLPPGSASPILSRGAARTGRGVEGAGLSKLHIVTETIPLPDAGQLTISAGGSLVRLQRPGLNRLMPTNDATRGRISEWSAKSRMALKCVLGRLRRDALAGSHFVSLTYPAEFPAPDDHGIYKNHLRVMGQAMRREFGENLSAVWKLEFQKRGAAHFHLLVFGIEGDVATVRQWFLRRWFEIVGSGDEKHARAGTQVDVARSVAGAMSYLCKYLAKEDQTRPGNFTGRYWGKVNGKALPEASPVVLTFESDREANMLARCMRKIIAYQVNNSRWKRALSEGGHWMQARAGWTRQAAEFCMSGSRSVATLLPDNDERSDQITWHDAFGVKGPPPCFKIPRKYRPPRNSSVRLIVDASAFMADFLRGRERGLWKEPEPF